ncbi:hypothetical protein DV738_g745, partial [Chaetothyriales sp. CBS 135597]
MHPFSSLAIGIFVAGYITARWDLVTRLYELAFFAWDHGVFARVAKAFTLLSVIFVLVAIPIERLAAHEASLHPRSFMVKTKDDLLRVFWPNPLSRLTTPGVIVGWKNSESDLFAITVLEDVEVKSVEAALRMGTLFRNSPHPVARIFQVCDRSNMHVLGTFNYALGQSAFEATRIAVFTSPACKRPRVVCGRAAIKSSQIITFDPPDPQRMQYLSLTPISLSLGVSNDAQSRFSRIPNHPDEIEQEEARERKRKARLVAKLKFHTVVRHPPTKLEAALPMILRQINCSKEVAELLQKNSPLVGPRRKRTMSVSERVVESAQSLYTFAAWSLWGLFMTYAYPLLIILFKVVIIIHRAAAEAILQLLELPLPIQSIHLPDGPIHGTGPLALKDVSAACQQIHLRLEQLSYYPTQYSLLRQRSHDIASVSIKSSDYIRFYNSLWLVANDVILGIALGTFIKDNVPETSALLAKFLNDYTIDGLKRMIRWLMSYPGGLKLNTELAAFLGDLFLWVIEYWAATVIRILIPLIPIIVTFVGLSSLAGASLPIAIFSDLISLLTIHIYSFYIASARIFNWQLTIIVSLFHLFRGKKRNVLRNRIDSCDYDLDQLLLGTILFTVLFFLLPTVVVFYLTFASARMAIISLKASLDTWLVFLNHFPLFALMLRLKDSGRLPDEDEEGTVPPSSDCSYITLYSTPLSFREIFEQYSQLGNRIRKHYLSPKVVFRLLTGRLVPPLGREEMYCLQYSVLPRERVSIGEVWAQLNAKDDDNSSGGGGGRGAGSLNGHLTGYPN